MMAELGRMDIETRWLAHTLRFWNSLCDQPPDSLHHQLLLDAQTEALLAGTRNWVWGLRQACQRLGYQLVLSTRRAQRVDVRHVMDRHSGDGHGRLSAYAHGHARARAQPSAHTGGGLHARRGNRNACRFSASGTRRGRLASIYDFGLGAALCRW